MTTEQAQKVLRDKIVLLPIRRMVVSPLETKRSIEYYRRHVLQYIFAMSYTPVPRNQRKAFQQTKIETESKIIPKCISLSCRFIVSESMLVSYTKSNNLREKREQS